MTAHRLILIPGQKKSGTTSLHAALAAACPAPLDVPKESGILALAPAALQARLAREAAPRVLIDATTTYFRDGAFPGAMQANLARFAQVQVLLMHRPEAARLASHYRHAQVFDGHRGTPVARFVETADYRDHADLTAMVAALRAMGARDIRIVPFATLSDADALAALVADVLGPDAGAVQAPLPEARNAHGSRPVASRPVNWLVSRPEFQVILRPLMPARLRLWLKARLSRLPEAVEATGLDAPAIEAGVARIDARNAALRARLEAPGP